VCASRFAEKKKARHSSGMMPPCITETQYVSSSDMFDIIKFFFLQFEAVRRSKARRTQKGWWHIKRVQFRFRLLPCQWGNATQRCEAFPGVERALSVLSLLPRAISWRLVLQISNTALRLSCTLQQRNVTKNKASLSKKSVKLLHSCQLRAPGCRDG
jgi:hypothetical protein